MDNIEVNRTTNKRPNRVGENNPMFGRKHSQESKNKMSQAAIRRNQEYQKAIGSQHHITMDEFLSNNPSVKEYLMHLVRQQIQETLWRKNNQRI